MEINHFDFTVLIMRIMEVRDLSRARSEKKRGIDAQLLSRACLDLPEKEMHFCPACTNLTLRIRHVGTFD